MFERYTEKARRVIFFARYEAGALGSPAVEAEHVLLGLLRADPPLLKRFLPPDSDPGSIRRQILDEARLREVVPSGVELPLSEDGLRVLMGAAEEAGSLGHGRVDSGHILLGLLRDEQSYAAGLLIQRGVRLDAVREALGGGAGPGARDSGSGPE